MHVCACVRVCVVGGAVGPCGKLTSRLLSPPPRPSPPDTIRKMKNDFRKMEDEMDRLATNMAVITDFSARISATLQDRHERITKLAGGPCPRAGAGAAYPEALGLTPPVPGPQGSTRCCGSCSSSSSCPRASPSAWSWAPTGRRCATRAARGPSCSSTSTCPRSAPSRMTARSSRLAWLSSCGSASGVAPGTLSHPPPGPWACQLRSKLVPLRPPARIRSACP